MRLLAEINEADVGSVRAGTPVTFEVESIAGRRFTGTVAEVRLQPMLDQASSSPGAPASASTTAAPGATAAGATSASTAPASTPRAVGTSGTSAAQQAAQPANASQAPAAPAGAVVAYTAVIDVDNSNEELRPGNTAILTLPAAQRASAVRVPNRALAFRPSPEVFEAVRQDAPELAGAPAEAATADRARGRPAYVWKFEDGRFVPIAVRVGLADEAWTELIEGPLQPGDQLVITAERGR